MTWAAMMLARSRIMPLIESFLRHKNSYPRNCARSYATATALCGSLPDDPSATCAGTALLPRSNALHSGLVMLLV